MSFEINIREELIQILGKEWVKDDKVTLYTYQCDGLTLYKSLPMGVVFPGTVKELVLVVKILHQKKNKFCSSWCRHRSIWWSNS